MQANRAFPQCVPYRPTRRVGRHLTPLAALLALAFGSQAAPVGGQVSFPNKDGVRHHVYSFSPAKRFELKLYGRDESRSVRFEKAGVVALGCNIHDSMVAFIKVVDTPYAAKSDASGNVVLRGVPEGAATVRVWHPYMRQPGNEIVRQLTLRGGHTEAFVADLRTPPTRTGAY